MSILVIGDIMLDINYITNVNRIAPEANIPIYNILETKYILGGASNVAFNLNNLNMNVELISIIGDDSQGIIIKDKLDSFNIKNKLFKDKNRHTTQKNRIFLDNKLCVRYDIEDTNEIETNIENDIITYVLNKQNVLGIIISDYDKGLITEKLSQIIIDYSNKNSIPIFVDPKLKNYMKYKNCFLFKPNIFEAEHITNQTNYENQLNIIKQKINCKHILLTRGKEGMILDSIDNKIEHNNIIDVVDVVDVTGAGDIVMAVLVYNYIKTNNLFESAKLANYIGGKSVKVVGNYNVTINDIDEYYTKFNSSFKILDNKLDNKLDKIIFDNEIDNIKKISLLNSNNKIVFTNGCFDILHSAHIELLQFSKSQGDILVVGLNSDESIKRIKGQERPINDINERSKILSLFSFIDYIIIFNDDTPYNVINILKPNILIKGADYNINNVIGSDLVKEVIFFNLIKEKSSTRIINKIKTIKTIN